MATHTSILAWEIPWTGGAWWAAVPGVTKSQARPSEHPQTWSTLGMALPLSFDLPTLLPCLL